MNSKSVEGQRTLGWLIVAAAGVRAAFGILMAIDRTSNGSPRLLRTTSAICRTR
jgi:hypothetical protein